MRRGNLRFRMLFFPLLALVLSVALVACGGDDDDDVPGDDGGGPTAASDDYDDGAGDDEGGTATLTIGDESWTFDEIICAFSPEEAVNPNVAFYLRSTLETEDGRILTLDATIIDDTGQGQREGENVIKTVFITDLNADDGGVNWSTIGQLITDAEKQWAIEDKNVHVEAVFDDRNTDEIVEVQGTLDGTCP